MTRPEENASCINTDESASMNGLVLCSQAPSSSASNNEDKEPESQELDVVESIQDFAPDGEDDIDPSFASSAQSGTTGNSSGGALGNISIHEALNLGVEKSEQDSRGSPATDYLDFSITYYKTDRVQPRGTSWREDTIGDCIEQIVVLYHGGAFDFFDFEKADDSMRAEFELIFLAAMGKEFGPENGAFLAERFKSGRISPLTGRRVESIFDYASGLFRKECLKRRENLTAVMGRLLRVAYFGGGLEAVDHAIERLNKRLKAEGAKIGLGPGSACMVDALENPAWLALIFSSLESEEVLAVHWVNLDERRSITPQ